MVNTQTEIRTNISAQDVEKIMFDAVLSDDIDVAEAALTQVGRDALEFTGRCFAHAITSGNVGMALFCARNSFHLNVLDEPTLRTRLDDPATSAHALREYLQSYRYCRAQRTYYLPIAQSELSLEPLAALLATSTPANERQQTAEPGDDEIPTCGLTKRDKGELLSLAVRFDMLPLTRLLVEASVPLPADPQETIPRELRGNGSQTLSSNPWVEVLSPHHDDAMLDFILEQITLAGERAPVRATWFKLHFREQGFTRRLAKIVPLSSGNLCEDIPATVLALAAGGFSHALSLAMSWPEASLIDLEPPLAAAQSGNHLECAALILGAMQSSSSDIQALDW